MRGFLVLLLTCLSFSSFALTLEDIVVSPDTNITKETAGVAATDDVLKNLTAKKIELESIISLEKNRTLDAAKKRDDLEKNLATIETGIKTWSDISDKINHNISQGILASASDEVQKLVEEQEKTQKDLVTLFVSVTHALDAGPFSEENTTPADIQQTYPLLRKIAHNKIRLYDDELKKAEDARDEFIAQKEEELKQIALDIERARYVKQTQLSKAIAKILTYVGIFLALLLLRYLSGRVLSRFQEDFSRPHKEAMWFIHRWSFRAVFLIAFLLLFSSEFSAFLPFIAIVATAIGFALRDLVYSFIGWFMIGANDGYEEGDIIQIEDVQGKVYKITPLLTTLEERGDQGVTGKMISFPNKVIFDKTVKNLSRSHGYTFTSIDFVITHTSNIDRAREILMNIIGQQDLTLYYNSRNIINKLRYTYGYHESDLHPRIDVIIDPKGVILRAKIFVHVEEVVTMRTRISEEFCRKIQEKKDVLFQKN